jgi:hypothetical protein
LIEQPGNRLFIFDLFFLIAGMITPRSSKLD